MACVCVCVRAPAPAPPSQSSPSPPPQNKTPSDALSQPPADSAFTPELKKAVDTFIAENKVVLFIKGTKDFPSCGFSQTVGWDERVRALAGACLYSPPTFHPLSSFSLFFLSFFLFSDRQHFPQPGRAV